MIYRYDFLDGSETVDVSEEWAAILEEMDREEAKNHRKETRRHTSLDALLYEGADFASPENVEAALTDRALLDAAFTCLTETQARRLKMMLDGMTYMEISEKESVSFQKIGKSIQQALTRLEKNRKNIFGMG